MTEWGCRVAGTLSGMLDAAMAPICRLVLLGLLGFVYTAHSSANPRELQSQTCATYEFGILKPTITTSPVTDLQWVGDDDQVVFAVTQKYVSESGGLWRAKTTNNNTMFESLTAKLTALANSSEPFSIIGILSQGNKTGNLRIIGQESFNWMSFDYGESFVAVPNQYGWRGSSVRGMKVHPLHNNWLLLLVKRPNCKKQPGPRIECPYDLLLNKDLFNPQSTWANLTDNARGKVAGFVDFDWGLSLCPKGNCTNVPDLPPLDENLILATGYFKPDDYDQEWDKDVHFLASTDLFTTFNTRVRCGNQFEVVGRSVYMAIANSCPVDVNGKPRSLGPNPEDITLYTSIDGGTTFVQACLPEAFDQKGYELIESHDGRGAVVVVDFMVDAGFMKLPASSVYTAGPHHALFSLSLTNVYHAEFGLTTDFTRVEGVPGIYIANQMLARAPKDPSSQDAGLPPNPSDSYSYSYSYGYYDDDDLEDLTEKPVVETRITFNGGGRWQRIAAPSTFRHPACSRCGDSSSCYLHLHGLSDWSNIGVAVPAVYSNPSAPGMVMATGNVAPLGLGLDKEGGICTFLSMDGGVTWTDVREGAYIYEFADWGGIIVMAKHPGVALSGYKAIAEDILFSMDYGNCWQTVSLEVPLLVDNIRIEPDGQRATVIVHGRACRNETSPGCAAANITNGLMYVLDVDKLMKDKGKGGQCAPLTDFETWSVPVSAKNSTSRCVLGEYLTFTRRKQSVECFQGGAYKRPGPDAVLCNCTRELDTECEYGFVRSNTSTCKAINPRLLPSCPVIDSGVYTVSGTTRRLVHGDKCLNPEGIIPDTGGTGKAKPRGGGGGSSSRSSSGWVMFLVIGLVVLVLGGVVAGWWRFRATDDQRDTVRKLAGSAGVAVTAAWWLLADNVSGLVSRIRHRSGGAAASGEELGYFQPLGDPGYDVEGRGNVFTLK